MNAYVPFSLGLQNVKKRNVLLIIGKDSIGKKEKGESFCSKERWRINKRKRENARFK